MKQTVLLLTFFLIANLSIAQSFRTTVSGMNSSFRGLSVVNDQVAWVSGTKGTVGRSITGGKTWEFTTIKGFETVDFRSLYAFDSLVAVVAGIASPGYVLRTTDGGKHWTTVYQNNDKNVFMDGIDFWDNKRGVIYGDAINGRMFMLTTNDGGISWKEVKETLRPQLQEGEGSFAASGTGIRCMAKDKLVLATGGSVSRLWIAEHAFQFKPITVPVIQGTETTGIFSVHFFDEKRGIVVGGDYKNDTLRTQHVLLTRDAGKTWTAPATPTRGFRECVQYIQENNLVAIGPGGADLSRDGGYTWQPLSDEKGYHVLRKARSGSLIVAAGNGSISLITF